MDSLTGSGGTSCGDLCGTVPDLYDDARRQQGRLHDDHPWCPHRARGPAVPGDAGRVGFEGLIAFRGLLFVGSPRVIGFTAFTTLAWTAWSVGVVALVAGAADLQVTRTEHPGHGVVTNR